MDTLDYDESCILDEILTNFPDDALLGTGGESWFTGGFLDSDPLKQPPSTSFQSLPERPFLSTNPPYEGTYAASQGLGKMFKSECLDRAVMPSSSFVPSSCLGKADLLVGIPAPLGTDWYGIGCSSDDELDDDDFDDEISNPEKSKKKRKRQKSNNPDAELIAQATEENLKMLNLDPSSKEGKRQRRRIRNRMSAQLHRERKKAYIRYLEGIVKDREARIVSMVSSMDALSSENERLRSGAIPVTSTSMHIKPEGLPFPAGYVSSSSNTDGDDSDTNSVASAQEIGTGHRQPSHTTFGSSFSLLSVVFMLGFTFFGNSPIDLNSSLASTAVDSLGMLELSGLQQLSKGPLIDLPGSWNPAGSYSSTLVENEGESSRFHSSLSRHQSWGSSRKLLTVSADTESTVPLDISADVSGAAAAAVTAVNAVQYQDFSQQNIAPAFSRLPTIGSQPDRREMALMTTDATSLPPLSLTLPVPGTPTDRAVPSSGLSRSKALWKYQDRVLHLFPTHSQSIATTASVRPVAGSKRRHLRARGSATGQREPINEESETDSLRYALDWVTDHRSTTPSSSQRVSTLAASSNYPHPTHPTHLLGAPDFNWQAHTTESSPVVSMSHVLMTEGRALLDPSLTLPVARITKPMTKSATTSAQDSSVNSDSSTYSAAVSTWLGHSGGGHSTRGSMEAQTPRVVSLGVGGHGHGSGPTGESNNMLLMLLPASSVRWGKTWGESAVYTTEALKHGLNVSDSAGGDTRVGNEEQTAGLGPDNNDSAANDVDDETSLWIEIGCSVVRAQLVRNVTMT